MPESRPNSASFRRALAPSRCPQVALAPERVLPETLERGSLKADDADLEALARLLLVAMVSRE